MDRDEFLVGDEVCFRRHCMAFLRALNVSGSMLPALTIRFDGDELRFSEFSLSDIHLMQNALANLDELTINGRPNFFYFIEDQGIVIPALKKLVLWRTWILEPTYVERFCARHAQNLRVLHLQYWSLNIDDDEPTIPGTHIPLPHMEAMRRIRDRCSLREFKSSTLTSSLSSPQTDLLIEGRLLPTDESPLVFF